jgi:putative flippase GtrA
MVTEERGTAKRFAKNSMQASLARPSTGGAVKASFSASPTAPVMAFFLARGWTFTAKATPADVSRTGIMAFDFTTES